MNKAGARTELSRANGDAASSSGAATRECAWRVVDTLPRPVPITAGEIEAIATYLWADIEVLLLRAPKQPP